MQSAWDAKAQQLLPARGAIEVEEIDEIVIGGSKTKRRVRQDREERDEEGADENRRAGRKIDEEQGRDRDDRRYLHDDGEGKEGAFDDPRLSEQHRQGDAAHDRYEQRLEGDVQRHEQRSEQR